MNRRQLPRTSGQSGTLPVYLQRSCSFVLSSIPLFNCSVAGFQYYDGLRCIKTIRPGDRLDLLREPENPHDTMAIAVHAPNDGKLGFLPRNLNEIPAFHMDGGRKLHAVITCIDRAAPPWDMLEIKVVMS